MHKLIGFIPARSGSKGVPWKNFRRMGVGPSLVERAHDEAWVAGLHAVVCIDDGAPKYWDPKETVKRAEDIRSVKRPRELATDTATVADLLKHYEQDFRKLEATAVMVLYPTYALRTADDIAWIRYEWLKEPERGLVGIVPSKEPAHLLVSRLPDDRVVPAIKDAWAEPNRQGWVRTYRLCLFACVVPVAQIQDLPGQPVAPGSRALEIPSHKALDVDVWDDWFEAERILCGSK